jgi:cytochrome c556
MRMGEGMKKAKLIGGAVALVAMIGAAYADVAVIKERQTILKGWGDATKPVGATLRGQAPFDLAVTQAALRTIIDGSKKLPDLFPDDSKTGETAALPVIWEDKAKFVSGYQKIGTDAAAALAAITDEASFKTEMPKVFGNCGACHKVYRKPT